MGVEALVLWLVRRFLVLSLPLGYSLFELQEKLQEQITLFTSHFTPTRIARTL